MLFNDISCDFGCKPGWQGYECHDGNEDFVYILCIDYWPLADSHLYKRKKVAVCFCKGLI